MVGKLLGPQAEAQIRKWIREAERRLEMRFGNRARYTKRGSAGTCTIQRRYVCSGGVLTEQWRYCGDTSWTDSSTQAPPDD